MKPDAPTVLDGAMRVLMESASATSDDQERARLHGVISALSLLRREWDTAVATRTEVADGYREVLRWGLELLGEDPGPGLRAARPLLDAPLPLTVSGLDAALDTLRTAVIELQTWLEGRARPRPQDQALGAAIWRAEYADARSEDRYTLFW